MKKLILAAICVFQTAKAFPQGQLVFANNVAQTITNSCTGLPSAGGPAQDDTQVGLYIGNVGDSVSSLTLIGTVTNCFAPGRFNGGTRTLAGWGGTVQLQVRAWLASTVYPTYEAAYAAALGGDDSAIVGASDSFSFALTVPPTPPLSIGNGGLGPFRFGRLYCVPEPSALGLELLGLSILALVRRKK